MKLQDIFKKLYFVAGCAALVCVANVNDSHAATASASAGGSIIAPIAISQSANLNFGTILPGAGEGTVTVAPGGGRSVNGVTAPAQFDVSNPPAAAAFNVTGQSGMTFSITLPTVAVSMTNGTGGTMTADGFTSNPSGTGTLTGGAVTLNVGATLHVAASQAAGTYSGNFDVTVEYN